MAEAIALNADVGTWRLAALADEALFDRHYLAVAAAIADRITAKVHINIAARHHAFSDWIDSLKGADPHAVTYQHFFGACAGLIASLARHRIVAYSAMTRESPDRMVDTVLKFPNEVTALASGAAVYLLRVRDLTGVDPSIALSALVVESAAANLRRHPEAAADFRALLQLSTPWS